MSQRGSQSAFSDCPVCGGRIASALMNDHLDECLSASASGGGGRSSEPAAAGRTTTAAAAGAPAAAASAGGSKRPRDAAPEAAAPAERRPAKLPRPPPSSAAPLAERMRPQSLSDLVGQDDALATLAPLVANDRLPSLVLWGPPGCGKTSFAAVVERETGCLFKRISAVTCGVQKVREVVDAAAGALRLASRRTILFVDEIHRFNKGQQDAFLPHVENGTITLLGATTENPSFSLNSALLSRCR